MNENILKKKVWKIRLYDSFEIHKYIHHFPNYTNKLFHQQMSIMNDLEYMNGNTEAIIESNNRYERIEVMQQ